MVHSTRSRFLDWCGGWCTTQTCVHTTCSALVVVYTSLYIIKKLYKIYEGMTKVIMYSIHVPRYAEGRRSRDNIFLQRLRAHAHVTRVVRCLYCSTALYACHVLCTWYILCTMYIYRLQLRFYPGSYFLLSANDSNLVNVPVSSVTCNANDGNQVNPYSIS